MMQKVLGPGHVTSGTAFWSSTWIPQPCAEPWGHFCLLSLHLGSQLPYCSAMSLVPPGLLLAGAPLEMVVPAEHLGLARSSWMHLLDPTRFLEGGDSGQGSHCQGSLPAWAARLSLWAPDPGSGPLLVKCIWYKTQEFRKGLKT